MILTFLAELFCQRSLSPRMAGLDRTGNRHAFSSEAAAPIYIVEIPSMYGKPLPPEHETARQVAELCQLPLPHDLFIRDAEGVVREFRRRQFHAVQPFHNQGLGSIGKTELAFTFAHAYAGVYPGGRYDVRCENQASLQKAFAKFEDDPFQDEIIDAERNNPEANFNAVLRCLKKRLAERGSVLLILDNVSEPDLVRLMPNKF